jgi:hypothetical protein
MSNVAVTWPESSRVVVAVPRTTSAQPDQEHAGGVRIEGAGVADPPLTEDAPTPAHHVMGRAPRRLVDDHQAVGFESVGQSAVTTGRASRRAAKSSGTGRGDTKPAAVRCPPPPNAMLAHVEPVHRSQRRLGPVRGLLEHGGDVGLGGAAEEVDQALRLVEPDAVLGQVGGGDPAGDEAALAVVLGPLEDGPGQAQVGQAVLLEELAVHGSDGEVEAGQLPGQLEHLGRGAVVLEPPGVAHQAGVQALRRLAVEVPAQSGQQAADDDGRGRGVGVDQVHRAVAVVGAVVVDHDQLVGPLGRGGQLGQAAEGAAVEGDHEVGLGREVGRLGGQLQAGQEGVVGRDVERLGPRGHRLLPGGEGQVVEGQHGAERIPVGGVVAGQGQGGRRRNGVSRLVEGRAQSSAHWVSSFL